MCNISHHRGAAVVDSDYAWVYVRVLYAMLQVRACVRTHPFFLLLNL